MNVIKGLLGVLLSVLIVKPILADEVVLTSGDRLFGTITELNNQRIVIDTAFAKALEINHKMIVTLTTDTPVRVVFDNGESVSGQLYKHEDSIFNLTSNEIDKTFEAHEIAPDQSEEVQMLAQDKIKYSGEIDVGLSRSTGNEDEEDYQGNLMLQARTEKTGIRLSLQRLLKKIAGKKHRTKHLVLFS
tara:strand:+ start:492 stop:1055 length:564 start_codon:yes stop_codon:yes gene_type:complete